MTEDTERLYQLASMIGAAIPRADPDPVCWLNSDATYSYCWPCARDARARELGMIVTPRHPERWCKNEYDRWFEEGIDGGYHGGGESDNPEHCETCGMLLAYSLTDYGARQEVDHFLRCPVDKQERLYGFDSETAYELDRIFAHGTGDGADPALLRDLLVIADGAIASLAVPV